MNLSVFCVGVATACYAVVCINNCMQRDYPHGLMWFSYTLGNLGLLWYEYTKLGGIADKL